METNFSMFQYYPRYYQISYYIREISFELHLYQPYQRSVFTTCVSTRLIYLRLNVNAYLPEPIFTSGSIRALPDWRRKIQTRQVGGFLHLMIWSPSKVTNLQKCLQSWNFFYHVFKDFCIYFYSKSSNKLNIIKKRMQKYVSPFAFL